MADSAPVLIWISDTSKACIWFNHPWLTFVGRSMEEEIGHGWAENVHPEDFDRCLQIYTQFFDSRRPFKMEYRLRRSDGEYRWVLDHGIPRYGKYGEFMGYIGSCIDITERKIYQQALEDKTHSLEITNRELEQFAYIASHDLQEPLHMINSFVDLLCIRCDQKLDNKEKEYLDFVRQGSRQAKTLIHELLEYSRIGREKSAQMVDLQTVLREVQANLKISIDESKARVSYCGLPSIKANYSEMVQLFQNLISNAIKYRSQEPPQINISYSGLEGDQWLFAVKDNGIGIDPQYKERIFGMFQRLHPKSEYSGTGIGLAICKKIVEQHSGRIWVESQPGQGSTFYFTLSAQAANRLKKVEVFN
jgi:PAS domain S-box-containing protein